MSTVEMALAGDQDAFTQLYRQAYAAIHKLMWKMFGSDAEDMTQECFMHIFRKLRLFDGRSKFSTWAYKVALNRARMELRKRNSPKRLLVKIDASLDQPLADGLTLADSIAVHDGRLEQADNRLDLIRAIGCLPKKRRMNYLMAEIDGLSSEEIAERTGTKRNSAKTHVHYARQQLRGLL
jgi:RNA polymerase sigma-70 factor (ECF subfamily)